MLERDIVTTDPGCVLLDGLRLPFAKSNTLYTKETAIGLGSRLLAEWIQRSKIPIDWIDQIVVSQVHGDLFLDKEPSYFQKIKLLPESAKLLTLSEQQAEGMAAIAKAKKLITSNQAKLVLCIGIECGSDQRTESSLFNKWIPSHLQARFARLDRWSDTDLSAFQLALQRAEDISTVLGISAEMHHLAACHSHERADQAWEKGYFDGQVIPTFAQDGGLFSRYTRRNKDRQHGTGVILQDPGIRMNCHPRALAAIPARNMDPKHHLHAAHFGYAADGATLLLLGAKSFASHHHLPWDIELLDTNRSAAAPTDGMLLGSIQAIHFLLQKENIRMEEVDFIDIHEDSTATILALQTYMKKYRFQLNAAEQQAQPSKLPDVNPCGGAIALGNGGACSMMRQLLLSANYLLKNKGTYAIIAHEHASNQGDAVLLHHSELGKETSHAI